MKPTVAKMTQLLTEAADAHHKFEKESGTSDSSWQSWYATYMVNRMEGCSVAGPFSPWPRIGKPVGFHANVFPPSRPAPADEIFYPVADSQNFRIDDVMADDCPVDCLFENLIVNR